MHGKTLLKEDCFALDSNNDEFCDLFAFVLHCCIELLYSKFSISKVFLQIYSHGAGLPHSKTNTD